MQANTWPLTAYAAYLPRPFYAYGSLGYALNLFNLDRDISFGGLNRTATSSTTGNMFNAYGETGYDVKMQVPGGDAGVVPGLLQALGERL